MPSEYAVCESFFNLLNHIIENRATRNFCRLLFNKFANDFKIFSLGKIAQFLKLCLNTQHLLILHISGLARIQKEFLRRYIFHTEIIAKILCFRQSKLGKIALAIIFFCEPPPPKQISARKRAKNPEFCGGKSVGRASRVLPKSWSFV